jgi:hypothetical protein
MLAGRPGEQEDMKTALLMKNCHVADQPLLGCPSMVKYRVQMSVLLIENG